MPRFKTKDKHLPARMRRKGACFYYVTTRNGTKWLPLGKDYTQALLQWRELEGNAEGAATVPQLLENALVVMSASVKPSTLREHARARKNLADAFKGAQPRDVEPRHIAQYLERRSAKVAANREIAFLSSAWELARRLGWINLPNPCTGVKRNKERSRKRVARPAEIAKLLERDCPEADMVELTLLTGLRESDMLNLTLQQLEDDGIRVKPKKTETNTEVEQLFLWTPELRAVIDRAVSRRRRVGSMFLFGVTRGSRAGQPYTVNSFQSLFHRYFASCGIEGLIWHDLRRTALNLMRDQVGKEAAQRMGAHGSIVTTEGYLTGVGAISVTPVTLQNMRSQRIYENADLEDRDARKTKTPV